MVDDAKQEKIKGMWARVSSPEFGRAGGLAARATAIITGWFLMMVGVVLILTLCGAVIGLPLAAFGFLLMARGLF